ncbi:MAG TPA: amidohydrolase [Anaerolineae bacterium]|nr:amidohydrolase [Anaerolineae bacterium]HQI86142.1 amidohydrolase [Anaerolineae bacterium]
MTAEYKQVVIDWIDAHRDLIVDAHQKAWAWAEVGLQEHQTGALLADILEAHGFTVERGVAGMPTAFVATYGVGSPGVSATPVIGVMAELDALPGLSQQAVPYRAPAVEGGAGHGCGHCSYAATALGAALAVKAAMDANGLPGTIKCFGCPAEETLIGKVFMVRDGVFDGLDACLGHHPGSANTVFMGHGNAMNSAKFEFFGRASHAAGSPEQGISALDAVELMNIGVNYMREHVVQEARIHYVIEEGGHEPNVVPAYARSWYYVRAPTRDLVDQYYARVLRIADGADMMVGTTHTVRFQAGAHQTIANGPLAEMIVANMREVGAPVYTEEELTFARELGKSIPVEEKLSGLRRSLLPNALELADVDINPHIYDPYGAERKGGGGSTDVAEVSWITPTVEFNTAQFIVGSPGHSWQNTAVSGTSIGHKSTLFAAKVMAATVIDLLTQPESLAQVRADFDARMVGLTYKSPLPPDLQPPLDQFAKSHA